MDDKHYRARVTKRVDFAPDLWMIRIDPGAEFSFVPGQYAPLGIERDGRRLERPYSMVSSPYEKELELFFELVSTCATTPPLYDLQLGDEILVRKVAKGRFTFDTAQPKRTNNLMVSSVTGIAPFVSSVRPLFKDWKDGRFAGTHKLFLLNGASRSWEFGYREELEDFSRQAPWFRCVFAVSRPWEDDSWKGEGGRVCDVTRKFADRWGLTGANRVGYLCGHPERVEHAKGILRRIGFNKENLKEEVYWPW